VAAPATRQWPTPTPESERARRRDDLRLLTGAGRYLDDLPVGRTLHMAIVRSPLPHARLRSIDAAPALSLAGVHRVIDGRDLLEHLAPFPAVVRTAPAYRPLAIDRVRYVGEPVAVVLADDRYLAEDGAAAVRVNLETLEPVIDPRFAASDAAPLLHDDASSNVAWSRAYRFGDPEAAFASATRVVSIETAFPRYNSTPLETYALVAEWVTGGEQAELTVHSNFQGPFSLHPVMCRALGLESHQLRLVTPEDIGGSFGNKAMIYPYIVLAGACSKLAGGRVKWIEDRREHLAGSASGTNRVTRAEAAVDEHGTVHAVSFDILEDVGAYLRAPEPSCVMRSISGFAGPYRIAHAAIDVRVVLTNKLVTGLNRGYGGQQHIFTLERLIDQVAAELGLDPVEVRQRNFIGAGEFPYTGAGGTRYDSGDYRRALEAVLEQSGYRELKARGADRGDRWIGVGLATAVHSSAANLGYVTLALEPEDRSAPGYRAKSGSRDWTSATVDLAGKVVVEIGTAGSGQAHRATITGIVSEVLEVDPADVRVVDALDTGRQPWSVSTGSYSSRFAVMVGNAALLAAEALREQLLDLAAMVEGIDRDALAWSAGAAVVLATGKRMSLRSLAGAAHWDSGTIEADPPSLAVTRAFTSPGTTSPDAEDRINPALCYGFMADVAVVEVDKETFIPRLRRYHAVHDVGRTLDPAVVAGQMYGGVVHGMGGALLEELAYGDDGRLLIGDLMDYRCPEAGDAPEMHVDHANVPSPSNRLGVKGAGESSAMSAPAAIAAAVEDAMSHTGVSITSLPIDPIRLWAASGRSGAAD
jgi:2-furoyl-CoA dehydrogenase large subunit